MAQKQRVCCARVRPAEATASRLQAGLGDLNFISDVVGVHFFELDSVLVYIYVIPIEPPVGWPLSTIVITLSLFAVVACCWLPSRLADAFVGYTDTATGCRSENKVMEPDQPSQLAWTTQMLFGTWCPAQFV